MSDSLFGSRRARLVQLVTLTFFAALAAHATRLEAAGYICAEGGGGLSKGHWASKVFEWMTAHGGQRRVAVIGYHTDPDLAVERVFKNAGATSIAHLVIADRTTADSDAVRDALLASDIIWMRGGDQSKYVRQWRGTATEAAIRQVYDRGGVIGGTSAGAAVLGEVIYDAFNGSLTSAEALSNAQHPILTLTSDFLQLTPGVIFDTHFTERGRLGRLAVMVARRYVDAQQDLVGVGLDYRTALCVSPDLTAEVLGEGSVTILHRTAVTQQILRRGQPAVVTNLAYTQMTEGFQYDLKNRRVIKRPAQASTPSHPGKDRKYFACTMDGGYANSALYGEAVLDGADQKSALFKGQLTLSEGAKGLAGTIVIPDVLADDGLVENRIGGAEWAIAKGAVDLALLLTDDVMAESSPPAVLSFTGKTTDAGSVMILDGRAAQSFAMGIYKDEIGMGPRQSVAIENAQLHILSHGDYYDAAHGMPLLLRPAGDLTADGAVGREDLKAFADFLTGTRAASWQMRSVDANHDGRIDLADIPGFASTVLGD